MVVHHFGFWVEDTDTVISEVENHGGRYHPGPEDTKNSEVKFRDPNGIVFDISSHGWDGAKR